MVPHKPGTQGPTRKAGSVLLLRTIGSVALALVGGRLGRTVFSVHVGHDGGDELTDFLLLVLASGRDQVASDGLRSKQKCSRNLDLSFGAELCPPVERFHRKFDHELVRREKTPFCRLFQSLPLVGKDANMLFLGFFSGGFAIVFLCPSFAGAVTNSTGFLLKSDENVLQFIRGTLCSDLRRCRIVARPIGRSN